MLVSDILFYLKKWNEQKKKKIAFYNQFKTYVMWLAFNIFGFDLIWFMFF